MVAFAAIVVCCLEIAFVNSLLDAEYFDLYRDQNEVVGVKLNDLSYINDVGITLEDVDKLLEDLQLQFNTACSASASSPSADKSLALNSASRLQYVHYLCKSLWGAAAAAADLKDPSRDMQHMAMTEVGCSDLCAEVFEVIESILRRRCPLYFDQKQLGDLSVRTKATFLKLVLILLTEECMLANSFCLFSFEKISGNLHVVIRRISVGSDNSNSEGDDKASLTSGLRPLLPERRPVDIANKTARYRLADRIARKHLGSRVDVSEVDSKFGVLQTQIRLTLRGPVSMMSSGPHSSRSHKINALCPWYVIEYHRSSDDKLRDIKLQLDVLGVPWKAVHAYHIGSIRVKAQVAVVHETWFKAHHENVFKELLNIASAIIFVTEGSSAYVKTKGKTFIKIPDTTPAKTLFDLVQGLLKSLGAEPSAEGVDFVAHSRRNSIDFDMGDDSLSLKAAALMAGSYPQTAHFSSLQSSAIPLLLPSNLSSASQGGPVRSSSSTSIKHPDPDSAPSGLFSPGANAEGQAVSSGIRELADKWNRILRQFERGIRDADEVVNGSEPDASSKNDMSISVTIEKLYEDIQQRADDVDYAELFGSIVAHITSNKEVSSMASYLPVSTKVLRFTMNIVSDLRGTVALLKDGKLEESLLVLAELHRKSGQVSFQLLSTWINTATEVVRLVKLVVGSLPPSSPNMSLLTGLKTSLASGSNVPTSGADISISVRESVKSNASASNASNFSSEPSDEQKFRSTALQQLHVVLQDMIELMEISVMGISVNLCRSGK